MISASRQEGSICSKEEFKCWVAACLASIDDCQFKIVEIFQNKTGDRVVTRWRVTGKNNGFMGFPVKGAPINMTGTAVIHVRENGLLQHNWVKRNALEVYRRLAHKAYSLNMLYEPNPAKSNILPKSGVLAM